jgi:hypothetical protein
MGDDMADANLPKWPPLIEALERYPGPDDYRPGASARARPALRESEGSAMKEIDFPNEQIEQKDEMTVGTAVNLRKLQEQLLRKPLDDIATLIHGLTYGEMIELSEAIWKAQPEGTAITAENLPALLHRWSKSRPAPEPASA